MLTNLLILLVSVAIAVLILRFFAPKITHLKTFAQRILTVIGVLILFLGINLGLARYAQKTLQATIDFPPIATLAALKQMDNGAPVIVVAIASPDNPIKGRNNEYLAYVDGNGLWTPKELLFDLDDAQIEMYNDTYDVRNWKRDNKLHYINPGQRVVIVGENIKTQQMLEATTDKISHRIKGDLVFAGTHQEFLDDLNRRLWIPRIMAGLNAFAMGAIALTTLIAAIKTARCKPQINDDQSSPEVEPITDEIEEEIEDDLDIEAEDEAE